MGSTGKFLPWLAQSFHDFAGSTVVHTIGGFIALSGAIVLGPRLGRRSKKDGGGPMMPHDLTIAATGGLILWFGWYGFNPGSTLSAMGFEGIGRVAANTTLAACSGGLLAMIVAYMMSKTWDVSFTANGFLAGLVAITCPCYWVSPTGAILLGAVAGVVVVWWRRTSGVAANRRSHWSGTGARFLRNLGHPFTRFVCSRQVRRHGPVRGRQFRPVERAVLWWRRNAPNRPSDRQRNDYISDFRRLSRDDVLSQRH